MVKEVYSEV